MASTPVVIPRELLQLWLQFGDTAPLPVATRRVMEQRFGADFSDVRVHTGPVVAQLCQTLNARALTLGNNVLFGDGEYTPHTAEGRWLLAHELAHVLQQRSAAVATRKQHTESAAIALGDTGDASEQQADDVAAEAINGAVSSRITPDFSGAMRMTPMPADPQAPVRPLFPRVTRDWPRLKVVAGRDCA